MAVVIKNKDKKNHHITCFDSQQISKFKAPDYLQSPSDKVNIRKFKPVLMQERYFSVYIWKCFRQKKVHFSADLPLL